MTTFDLIQQPWIPVSLRGAPEEVSLLDAFRKAHEIDGLALDYPLQTVALLRQVLLPVMLDALGAPGSLDEWAKRWKAGTLEAAAVEAYLAKNAERFDLFHPIQPFAQVGDLRVASDDTKPVSLLLAEIATGNSVPLFSSRTEADPPALSPAEAVRALLTAQCWDTAGIKSGAVGDPQAPSGKTYGNPIGPIGQLGVVIPLGRTLAETLVLNTPTIAAGLRPGDRPQWRSEVATESWERRPAVGLLDLLTWQSRRIRLVPKSDEVDVSVPQVIVAAGDRLDQLPEYEPHTTWRQIDKPRAGQAPIQPVRHQSGRAAWRGMAGLLATREPSDKRLSTSFLIRQITDLQAEDLLPIDLPLQVLTVGVTYGNQSAVVEDANFDVIPLPVAALAADSAVRQLLIDMAGQAEELRVAANHLGDDLRRAAGGGGLPWDKSQRLGEALVHQFTPAVRRLLIGLQRQPNRADQAEDAWRRTARQLALEVAEPLLAAAPPVAFLGRQESEKVIFRASIAEARYRAAIDRILGRISPDQSDDRNKAGARR